MSGSDSKTIPEEATQACDIVLELLGSAVVGVYLFGSAVIGGLRVNSDVDVLVVANQGLSETTRSKLAARLMNISGRIGNRDFVRPLEVTVINLADVVPWRYPPQNEFLYGEWLRDEFEQGQIPEPTHDPDLAIHMKQSVEACLG
jgi:aminoglycoside 9-adenylyltransferase